MIPIRINNKYGAVYTTYPSVFIITQTSIIVNNLVLPVNRPQAQMICFRSVIYFVPETKLINNNYIIIYFNINLENCT